MYVLQVYESAPRPAESAASYIRLFCVALTECIRFMHSVDLRLFAIDRCGALGGAAFAVDCYGLH
eukprot:6189382-Pleurochrysis_carterae.AAC.3